MKNTILTTIILCCTLTYCFSQFKVRKDEFIQMGYNDHRTLSFGNNNLNPNNGQYAIEYWENGLNFWRPWPTTKWGNYILFLRDDHNIGIGHQGSSQFRLDIIGDARATGIWTPSDRAFKANIKPLKNSLKKILQISGYSYNYKQDELTKSSKGADKSNLPASKLKMQKESTFFEKRKVSNNQTIGLIAQDIQKILPQAVKKDDNGRLNLDYNQMIPLLIEAIKDQQKQIETMKLEIRKLIKN